MTSIKDLKTGTSVKLSKLTKETHKTTPPARYSEVSLVKTLADLGIGRPSTFSSIVSLIQARGYVQKKGNMLYPTPLGFAVARLLGQKLPNFTAYEYSSQMEDDLETIAEGQLTREQFLSNFWNGKDGFDSFVEKLSKKVDYDEIKEMSTIDLHNGYSITFNKFGTYLQDDNGQPNEKGYLPSVRIDDDACVDDFLDAEANAELLSKSQNSAGPRELGVLEEGSYEGWTVYARDGKFGAFLQAKAPELLKVEAEGKKPTPKIPQPINQPLPEGLELADVELADVVSLFAEVKLPRWSPDKKWLVGIGKKGAYMGRKASAKGRPVFKSLGEEHDPRTVSFDLVKKLWEEAESKAPAKKTAAKKK